jgi:hypothetical protein
MPALKLAPLHLANMPTDAQIINVYYFQEVCWIGGFIQSGAATSKHRVRRWGSGLSEMV